MQEELRQQFFDVLVDRVPEAEAPWLAQTAVHHLDAKPLIHLAPKSARLEELERMVKHHCHCEEWSKGAQCDTHHRIGTSSATTENTSGITFSNLRRETTW
jgi:hypothetical protein